MERLRTNLQRHPTIAWMALLAYLAFNACFSFPFANEYVPFTFSKLLMLLVCYGIIGLCFSALLPARKGLLVWGVSLVLTLLGLGARYLLEFGEVSNTMNFTPSNLALYLASIPLYCALVYWICPRLFADPPQTTTHS